MHRSKTVERTTTQKNHESRHKSFLLTCIGLALLLATIGSEPLFAVPTGRYLYVLDQLAAPPQVEGFSVTMTTGVLVSLGACANLPFAAASIPTAEAVDPTGSYLYVSDAGAPSQIWGFTINPATGCLAPIAGTPWATVGTAPLNVHVTTDDQYVYVSDTNAGNASVEGFQITPGGVLAHFAGTPVAYGPNPGGGLAFDPVGPYLFAANVGAAGPIVAFDTAGLPVPAPPVVAPGCPCGTVTPNPIEMSASAGGQDLLVLSAGGITLDSYAINRTTGALGWVNTLALAADDHSVYADPFGRYAYVTSSAGDTIQPYTITPAGVAAANGAAVKFAKGDAPAKVVVDQWGKFVYISLRGSSQIAGYTINALTGKLAKIAGSPWATFVVGGGPTQVHAITP